MIYYTGIGSRITPENVLIIAEKLGYIFAKKGFILRSGAAPGFDERIEIGCDKFNNSLKEIFLPWKGFNGSDSPLYTQSDLAIEKAWEFHPNLYAQKESVIKLMARNTYQVLGPSCTKKTASDFVVCYCPVKNGVEQGGTAQALRIAKSPKYNIPVFNLFYKENLQELKDFIIKLEATQSE